MRIVENWPVGRSAVEGYSRSAGEEILRSPPLSHAWNKQTAMFLTAAQFNLYRHRLKEDSTWIFHLQLGIPVPMSGGRGNQYKLPVPGSPAGVSRPDYVARDFVFLGSIIICRLYKLTPSDQPQVTLKLRVSLSGLV
jgi:hypothetical protein